MSPKTEKPEENAPVRAKDESQVVDITESSIVENAQMGAKGKLKSSTEVMGAIKQTHRVNQIGEATIIIELSRVQAAFKGQGDLQIDTPADSFKEFIELSGLNYKTIINKIGYLKRVGPQMLQMFEQMGIPVPLQRQIGSLPDELRDQALMIISDPSIQSVDNVKGVVSGIYKEMVRLEDRINEAELKNKTDLVDELDQAKADSEMAESRMIKLNQQNEKLQKVNQKLKSSLQPGNSGLALRKINEAIEVYQKVYQDTHADDEDLTYRSESIRFQTLATLMPKVN